MQKSPRLSKSRKLRVFCVAFWPICRTFCSADERFFLGRETQSVSLEPPHAIAWVSRRSRLFGGRLSSRAERIGRRRSATEFEHGGGPHRRPVDHPKYAGGGEPKPPRAPQQAPASRGQPKLQCGRAPSANPQPAAGHKHRRARRLRTVLGGGR